MKPSLRNYKNEADYWRIRRFLREVQLLNDLHEWSWPVARLDYWRWHVIENCHQSEPVEQVTFLWETQAGELAAVLNSESSGSVFLQVHPAFKSASLEEEMLATAEEKLSVTTGNQRRLKVWVHLTDELRLGLLTQYGFKRTETYEHQWWLDLTEPVAEAKPAKGYTVRSLGEEGELPARSWASWRGFHPTEPDEKYQGWNWYHNIQRCPLYRRDLDMLAAADDGTIASFATFWYDDATRTAMIEPVATVPEHLRRGLARAVITEGLRRARQMGAVRASVSGMEAGPDALYASVLSPVCDTMEEWVREW
jgi:mycothiol synthase